MRSQVEPHGGYYLGLLRTGGENNRSLRKPYDGPKEWITSQVIVHDNLMIFPSPRPPANAPYKDFCDKGGRFGPHNTNQDFTIRLSLSREI